VDAARRRPHRVLKSAAAGDARAEDALPELLAADGEAAVDDCVLAERARRALAERPVQIEDMSVRLTASVGAAIAGEELATPDALVDAADRALYEAKGAGRDCVRVWGAPAPEPAA